MSEQILQSVWRIVHLEPAKPESLGMVLMKTPESDKRPLCGGVHLTDSRYDLVRRRENAV
jgi:hypothetical protein